MTRIQCLQHVPFEGPGYIKTWAEQNGHSFEMSRLYANDPYPKVEDYDFLVIMGGPMSVHDVDKFGWMREEKIFIRSAIRSGKTILGICLGAQLIAEALGAAVFKNPDTEIGWFPVFRAPGLKDESLADMFPQDFMAFHWHGETFNLPYRSVRLLSSEACENQAFLAGDRILGLQFHLETQWEDVDRVIAKCRDELEDSGPFIQTVESLIYEHRYFDQTSKILAGLLAYLVNITRNKNPI